MARLHQASATTRRRQLCDEASDSVLMENNGVDSKWVATWRVVNNAIETNDKHQR